MAVQRRASQIAFILHQAEEGVSVEEVCRKAGVSMQTDYRWRKKYGGLMPSEMKRLKCSKRRPEVARPKNVSTADLNAIISRVVQRSNSTIQPNNIDILR